MANYSYIDTSGAKQTVTANDSSSALSSAKNIAKNSGVMLDTSVITPASLAPVTPIPVVTPTTIIPSTSVVTSDINSGVTQAEQAYQDQLAKAKEMASGKAQLESLVGGKGTDTVNTYNTTGVNDLFNKLKDIQARSTGLQNEATAVPIQTQQRNANTGATDAGVAPQNAGALRENALKQLALGQEYAIASGNYEKAKNYADQIITAKYDQLDADIKAKQTNLDALKDFDLTPAQNKLLAAQQAKLTKEANDLADKRANEKTIQDTLIKAASFNAPQSVLDAIKNSKDVNSAITAATGYLTDPLDTQIKKANLANIYSEIANRNATTKNSQKIVKINGTDYIQNADGSLSLPKLPTASGTSSDAYNAKNKIAQIDALIGGKGEASSVGTNFLSRQGFERTLGRIATLGTTGIGVGNRANYIATVEQITKGLTLQSLIDAKANGATFGALSEGELSLLADSASKIDNWAVKDSKGKVKYYKANESDFNTELQRIKDLTQKAYDTRYGETDVNNYLDTVDKTLQNNTSIYSQAGYNVNQ